MSDATTLLSQRCYPDTCKSLREAVGVFFAHEQRSFVASKNSGGRQKVYFRSGKEGGCPAEVRVFKISTEEWSVGKIVSTDTNCSGGKTPGRSAAHQHIATQALKNNPEIVFPSNES